MLTLRETALNEGKFLADWLNDARAVEGQPTVLKAIGLLHQMNAAHRKGEPGRYWETSPNPPTGQRPGDQLLRILATLSRPQMVWSIMPSTPGYIIDLEAPAPPKPLEWAFRHLSAVTVAGLLDFLRQCKRAACRKWFMASREKNKFCSADCQGEYWSDYRKTPKGRKEQASHMRKSRARIKARASKAEKVKRSGKSQQKGKGGN